MILNGRQIRRARRRPGLHAGQVAKAAGVSAATVLLSEVREDCLTVTAAQGDAVREALGAAGVAFIPENGGAGVRLRKSAHPASDGDR